ncbi:hypothetical protein [Paraburkholderia sp.]|uniref:hypothetical protein n=1 Tax=Paraburkholderia sp. TaxID=1926495 RepID=UPI003C7CEB47
MRVEDITDLHVSYARAQMNRGAIPLPPIKSKRASFVPELPPVNAVPVELALEVPGQPVPPPSVAEAAAISAPAPSVVDTVVIQKTVPVVDAQFADLPSGATGPTVGTAEPNAMTPRRPGFALKASYLAIAAAIAASLALLSYPAVHTHLHVSEPPRKVAAVQAKQPKTEMTIPVVPTAASAASGQSGVTLPYDNVAAPGSGTQMNAAPARPVIAAGPPPPFKPAPPTGPLSHPLTAQDLMPDSPKPDFVRPASGLAHVDPRDFTGRQSRAAEPDTRVVEVQADGSGDAHPATVYEAPIRKVIRSLHRMVQPAPTATTKAPAAASAPPARHPDAAQTDPSGDQRLF